ncbi:MAG: hypothetical protein J2P54_03725 [Bradyrhizobiaceae bacterium]|nr:hypothetical protein [Bradyrhizobiaceae bacterium]
MRGIILGVILGILLTVGSAYLYDSITGRAANTPPANAASSVADDQRPVVNWDVVSRELNDLRAGLSEVGNRVQETWKKLTG